MAVGPHKRGARLLAARAALGTCLLACAPRHPAITSPEPVAPANPAAEYEGQGPPSPSDLGLTMQSVPRFEPAAILKCEPTKNLQELMRERFNPSMSIVSVALYRLPPDEGVELIVEATGEMLGCTPSFVKHLKHLGPKEDWAATDLSASQLQFQIFAMQSAAMEGDMNQVAHWYSHVKQSCAACHAHMWRDRTPKTSSLRWPPAQTGDRPDTSGPNKG